jgi:hypothetical protein
MAGAAIALASAPTFASAQARPLSPAAHIQRTGPAVEGNGMLADTTYILVGIILVAALIFIIAEDDGEDDLPLSP